jgi:hypothetical protein
MLIISPPNNKDDDGDDGDPHDKQLEQYQILLNHERELLQAGLPMDNDPTAEPSTWAKWQPTMIGIQQVQNCQYRPKTHAERHTENMR